MQWIQNYIPLGNLGLSALVAAIPLFILLYMLGIRRSKGQHAAFFATLAALLLAIFAWQMPVTLAVMATLNGVFFGLFPIVWIVITAIWVYNMTVESGEFKIIKNSLACITDDRRLQAMFIAFAFGSFHRRHGRLRHAGGHHRGHAGGPRVSTRFTPPASASSPTPRPWPSAPSASPSWWPPTSPAWT